MPDFQRLTDGTLVLTISLPWADVNKEYEHQITHAVEEAELPGFRKGKAPRNLVEPKLDKNQLLTRSIEVLLPKIYSAAIEKAGLKPILYPKIKILKGEMEQDWQFEATTCETPVVVLPDYQTRAKEVKTEKPEDRLGAILKIISETTPVTLPQILIDEEVNHRLVNLTDNLTKLGMGIDSYLTAKKTTSEGLRATMQAESQADLAMEFILQEIGKAQKLTDRGQVLDFLKTL